MSYRLLLLTPIPVQEKAGEFRTLDLWVRDLRGQLSVVDGLTLLASLSGSGGGGAIRLPEGVRVFDRDALSRVALRRLVREHDVVQIGPENGWMRPLSLRVAMAARDAQRCCILGISSNRAATARLNAQHKAFPLRWKAQLDAAGLLRNVRRLAGLSDGVFMAGHGLNDMLGSVEADVHFGVASWITRDEIIDEHALDAKIHSGAEKLRACIAARLEPMKGVHLAVDALRWFRDHGPPDGARIRLEILGEGPQKEELVDRVEQNGLEDAVHFGGMHAYPGPFFKAIGCHDVMLITNLNVEQPRIIFDSISQGLVPICPDSIPFMELGLDRRLLYRRGDAASLARVLGSFRSSSARAEVMPGLRELANRHTLESMHELRAVWIRKLLAKRSVSARD